MSEKLVVILDIWSRKKEPSETMRAVMRLFWEVVMIGSVLKLLSLSILSPGVIAWFLLGLFSLVKAITWGMLDAFMEG